MSEGLSKHDLDCLVAAILSAPRIDTNSTAAERVTIFSTTLKELDRHGGAAAILSGHARINPTS